MPSNKKKSQRRKSKRTTPASRKKMARSERVTKARTPKKLTKERTAQKKATTAKTGRGRSGKKRSSVSTERELQQEIRNRNFAARAAVSGRQPGDLQGLSRTEEADSESVDELVEEGNLFEAGAVAGVEEADKQDEREVHTHELPEDDVPEEYIDKD